MDSASTRTVTQRLPTALSAVLCMALLVFGTGCPSGGQPLDGTDNDNTSDGTGGVSGKIVNITTNFSLSSLDPPLSVTYSVSGSPESILGFYVPVADNNPGAIPIGAPVIVAATLPATGGDTRFEFDPAAAGVGFYRVGIIMVVNDEELTAESEGIIQVEGSPDPYFVQPTDAVTPVFAGAEVFVSFDAGDPEGDVQWRLFYLSATDSRDSPPDQLGTRIEVGSGNFGSATLDTTGFASGDYELGISATDSGFSIETTVSEGDTDRIVTIPNDSQSGPIIRVLSDSDLNQPNLVFTAPGSNDAELFRNQAYTLQFAAAILEPGATGEIELFYDNDSQVGNGFRATIVENLPASTTSYPLPTDLPEGTWYIGATIRTIGGTSPMVTYYATGKVIVVRNPTLTVNEPDSPLPVAPSTDVTVAWTTNAPASSGTVDVFARKVTAGVATGAEIPIETDAAMSTRSVMFSSSTSGLFEITVRLEFIDGTKLSATAAEFVRVSTVPPILWLGSLTDDDPAFAGAIFGGVNFEDNAGGSLTAAGDLDDDNVDDFVIGSRYGKPFFVNPSGVGPGEAYIIYGASGGVSITGEFSLNSVGSSSLRGVTLTGVRTISDSNDTDGLATIALIPDADDDGKDELAFGFPRTNSAALEPDIISPDIGPLERESVFLSGGVVILSSTNSILADPTGDVPVIALDVVGRQFSDVTVEPGDISLALDDQWRFEAGDSQAGTVDRCVEGTDGVDDTIIGPSVGFWDQLAPPLWEQLGFELYTGQPAEELCPTQYEFTGCPDDATWLFAGSGFYPATAEPLEPFGARLIGPDEGDGFGTSISASNVLGDGGRGDLLISAPNRTAFTAYVDGLSIDVSNAGVAFLANNRTFWGPDTVFLDGETPPTPHQYTIGFASHCGDDRAEIVGALRITGDTGDNIQIVLGIDDFNGDGLNDFAVGAPSAGGGQGRVYIAYRRQGGSALEGHFVLSKLELAPSNAERLDGMLVVTDGTADALGSSLATGFDFNDDGVPDLVIGSPNASVGVGEVIILFGDPGIVSGSNGISVDDLLSVSRTTDGGPVAVRITGNARDSGGLFGFNVANAGDVDGDGLNDLLIAAPNASPRFDLDPNDSDDSLTEPGLDLDFNGIQDDVSGAANRSDGIVDTLDNLQSAGIVYLVYGRNRLDEVRTCSDSGKACDTITDCDPGEVCSSVDMTISIDQLGTNQLRGFMIVGRSEGDRLGGGDAGDSNAGGISGKAGRGRSYGLASAGDVDGDGRADILIGSTLADPRRDPNTGVGVQNGGEAYLIYGSVAR